MGGSIYVDSTNQLCMLTFFISSNVYLVYTFTECVVWEHELHGAGYLNLQIFKFQSFKKIHKQYLYVANFMHYNHANL
jgi:hypothetical protein